MVAFTLGLPASLTGVRIRCLMRRAWNRATPRATRRGPTVATRPGVRAILVLLFASCSVGDIITGPDCSQQVEKTVDVEQPTDAPTTLKIESCRLDVDACGVLCSQVLGTTGIQPFPNGGDFIGQTFDKCTVTFQGATTHVDVAYTQFNSGPGCPVFEQGGFAP
jgi:hypothetical protein